MNVSKKGKEKCAINVAMLNIPHESKRKNT